MTISPEEQRWHWAEGNKYALEAMKALLWLNGGAAAALLAFFGGRPRLVTTAFAETPVSFGVGAVLSVALFGMGYFVQLQYGNESITPFRTYNRDSCARIYGVHHSAGAGCRFKLRFK
jgi:hypothetical protein